MAAERTTTALSALIFVMGFLRIPIARKSPPGKDVPPSQTNVKSGAAHSSKATQGTARANRAALIPIMLALANDAGTRRAHARSYGARDETCAAPRINRFMGTPSNEAEIAAIGNEFLTLEQKCPMP
jgi:hypothetical protein